MAHFNPSRALVSLVRTVKRPDSFDPLIQCLTPRLTRAFATQTELPTEELAELIQPKLDLQSSSLSSAPTELATGHASSSQILTTLYSWPELEPRRVAFYNPKLLNLPLRRDLLHRAVICEADASRQGTASTKWRADVHGSNRKILPQKGTGKARAGDKKSPIRRGGGVAFGPHPRDFSTELPRKIYDLAWRTALSYRYRRGELIVIDEAMDIPEQATGWLMSRIFEKNKWGHANGRSLLVTEVVRRPLYDLMDTIGRQGLAKDLQDVDVKDLLETGRIVIEKRALDALLCTHLSDLGAKLTLDFALAQNLEPIVHFDGNLLLDRRTGLLNVPELQGAEVKELDL